MNSLVEIYTDGACSPNPGHGGWAAILLYKDNVKKLSGNTSNTTNNRMELLACIKGLQALKFPCIVRLYSDSQYVCKGITSWLPKWKAQNWTTTGKTPVKNIDLWNQLDSLRQIHKVDFHWVRGHNGNKWNELADCLANAESQSKCTQYDSRKYGKLGAASPVRIIMKDGKLV